MGSKAEALGLVITEAELQRKIIYLVAIWAETALYGLYLCLFIGAVTIFAQKEVHKPFASKVFLAGNILIFIAISLHNALNVYRVVIGFAYQLDARASLLYLDDLRNWPAMASPVVLVIILWTGNALLIYRCFLIWQRNYRVIAILSLLYTVSAGLDISNLWWIAQQRTLVDVNAKRWPLLRITYPLYSAQSILNTGLILFRLGTRHRDSQSAGIVSFNTPSLVALMWAIVESAAIYTAALLAMVILCLIDHPGWYVGHLIMYPMTGSLRQLSTVYPAHIANRDYVYANGYSGARCSRRGKAHGGVTFPSSIFDNGESGANCASLDWAIRSPIAPLERATPLALCTR
ncbi:hypothetical protein BKA70DRAFT_1201071 [Coprinopsis sp. MPI-PUGE-AT-0042]|nr:hypothetical protein BKA70DRAFT_1201071 [Coprinopsis sp. MPI-PUGE-AT-0042]